MRVVLPPELLPYSHLDAAGPENVKIISTGSTVYLGFHLLPGQPKHNGCIRSEISIDYPCKFGDTIRYAWKWMAPKGFISDAPENRWWVVAQWHDQPDKSRGETWDGFPSRSPPVLFGIGEISNRLALGFEYGPKERTKKGPLWVEPGKWHSFAVEIRWSRKADGRVAVYLDDFSKPVFSAEGPNMNNEYQHYFKIGMYRNPAIQTDNWVYVDDIRIEAVK
ncbi:MAG: polysaccharide lyase [Spirochaetia bacterium]|nr:polysaccharide lyase [Spirochaetia bacterium]